MARTANVFARVEPEVKEQAEQELAKEAKAVYKIDKVVLVNCEIFEKY